MFWVEGLEVSGPIPEEWEAALEPLGGVSGLVLRRE